MIQALWALAIVFGALQQPTSANADVRPVVAVFDFELIDTSLDGEMNGPRADQHKRILEISDQLRRRLKASDKVHVVDIAPVAAKAQAVHLQECGGCDADLAKRVGATLSITGTVQKVSNLILNMSIYVRDATSGRMLTAMNADMRGNTDESWARTLDWLVRNRLMASLNELPGMGAHR